MAIHDLLKPGSWGFSGRGQAAAELTLIIPVLTVVLAVGLQFAAIGTAALALGQVDYQGVRYAAITPSASQSSVQSYMLSVASPIISASSKKYLASTLNPAPPCSFGTSVTVAVTFDTSHMVVLPNPFLASRSRHCSVIQKVLFASERRN